ncbi:hypothetical protein [Lysinibacillus sp. IITD104]|uniref:hypothetical protein n=1 Tax=unclassified Lysinibacillus TaxID=2636778 RepID=UPI002FCE92A8
MKKKIVPILIQAGSNILALWFVFVKQEGFFISVLQKFDINTQAAQRGILAALAVLFASLTINFLEWLIFEIIFKPVEIKVNFKNIKNNQIKKLLINYSASKMLEAKAVYLFHINISGGNKLTNILLNCLKSDIIIKYRPEYYQTEISNGWIDEKPSNQNFVYKDKKENTRIYWTHVVQKSGEIEDSIELRPELIICPTNFNSPKSQVEYVIGSHYHSFKILRFVFKIINRYLVKIDSNKLQIMLKEERN